MFNRFEIKFLSNQSNHLNNFSFKELFRIKLKNFDKYKYQETYFNLTLMGLSSPKFLFNHIAVTKKGLTKV
jgi:hypothetical protein